MTATPSSPSSRQLGYTVDLQYAQDDIANQLSQLENEITKGPKALIIASIDGTTMADALKKAARRRRRRRRL